MEAALEWAEYKASLCNCGRPRSETFDPKAEREFDAEALRCHACAAKESLARVWNEDEHANPSGVYFIAKRIDGSDD